MPSLSMLSLERRESARHSREKAGRRQCAFGERQCSSVEWCLWVSFSGQIKGLVVDLQGVSIF